MTATFIFPALSYPFRFISKPANLHVTPPPFLSNLRVIVGEFIIIL